MAHKYKGLRFSNILLYSKYGVRCMEVRADGEILGDVIIPNEYDGKPVLEIDYCGFNMQYGMKSVKLPDGLKTISACAFEKCSGLTEIVIPDSVTVIEKFAFEGCNNLKSVVIGKGVKKIGCQAFYGCQSLTNFTFNGTVAEWNLIEKGEHFLLGAHVEKVVCLDGEADI